jgi:cellulose synthase/poly-beta-1,6-N-acetylglucosamine synthase-like glycosyltransferase
MHSSGELIVTTDADCTAPPGWLRAIAARYEAGRPGMIVAPVVYDGQARISGIFQELDFMTMQGITAATHALHLGYMSNGANLAFTRAAFLRVGGYSGVDHIASGDDYLLMMKLAKAGEQIAYLKSTDARVHTPAQNGWKAFLQQRTRWASKSGKYGDHKLTAILIGVYATNLALLLFGVACLVHPSGLPMWLALIGIKAAAEYLLLIPTALFFRKTRWLWLFPLLQPLHILYIVVAGGLGLRGSFTWKGRTIKS